MEYRLSDQYIRMRENGPRRMLLMIIAVMALLATGTYLGAGGNSHDVIGLAIGFGAVALVFAVTTYLQIRAVRHGLANLRQTRFLLTEEGFCATDPSSSQLLKFSAITSVTIFRRPFAGDVRRIGFATTTGNALIPALDNAENFITELKKRLGHVPFREKRSWFM